MTITKKTGFGFLIISAVLSFANCMLGFVNINFALFDNIAYVSFGMGALILLFQSVVLKERWLTITATAALIAEIASAANIFENSFFGVVAWAFIASYALKFKTKAVALIIPFFCLLLNVLIIFEISAVVFTVITVITTSCQLLLSFYLFKSEEGSAQ